MCCGPSLGHVLPLLPIRVPKNETLDISVLRDVASSFCSGMRRGVARWVPDVASGRGTWGLAMPAGVPPPRLLGACFSPRYLLSLAVLQQQGSVSLLAPSQPRLPLLPILTSYHPTTRKQDGWQWTLVVAPFYHPLPSSSATSSSLPGKPPPSPLLVHES